MKIVIKLRNAQDDLNLCTYAYVQKYVLAYKCTELYNRIYTIRSLSVQKCVSGDMFVLTTLPKRKVLEVPQLQAAALPRHQEKEETDKTKQAQIEQTCKKH